MLITDVVNNMEIAYSCTYKDPSLYLFLGYSIKKDRSLTMLSYISSRMFSGSRDHLVDYVINIDADTSVSELTLFYGYLVA